MAFLNRTRQLTRAAVALALAGTFPGHVVSARAAQPAIVSTQAVYAAFTLNLTRFVTWPANTFASEDEPLVIGTFPRDPINAELDAAVRDEMVNRHPIKTLRLQSLEDIAKCHVIFVSRGQGRQNAVLERCAGRPILTIGDADGFLELGGHVRFVAQAPHIRLSISPANLKASSLEARAQLLRIAAAP